MSTTTAEITQIWRHVNRQMHELLRSTVQEFDLPPMAYPVLRHIQHDPGVTVSQLARSIGTAKSHVSNMIDQLVREEYVEKRTDPADQRIFKLYLTPSAMGKLAGMGDRAQAIWALVFQELPEGELEDVARFMRTLLNALERANEKMSSAGSPHPLADGSVNE